MQQETATTQARGLGSTTPKTIWTAIAASTAEPPWRNTSSPASTAMGLAAATIACGSARPAGPKPSSASTTRNRRRRIMRGGPR
jgi:hypothetical protein